jgi:hypothetical protein
MRIINSVVLVIGYITIAYLLFERFHLGSHLQKYIH